MTVDELERDEEQTEHTSTWQRLATGSTTWILLILVGMIVVFSVMEPSSFATVNNARNIATNAAILRAEHEYDIEKSTYRILRLKSTVSYANGTTGVHDSSWKNFREVTDAEFDSHVPRDLLDGTRRTVRLTPTDIATRRLQELNRSRTTTQN